MESSRLSKNLGVHLPEENSRPHHGETVCDRTHVSGALVGKLAILAVRKRDCDAIGRHAPRVSFTHLPCSGSPGILSTMFLLVLQSFESFVSCSSKLSFSCCWMLAAISSFLASLNSPNVFWCSNFVAVPLLKKLFQDIQHFITLTGILRDILSGSSGLRSLRICPVFFGTIRTTL